jgi:hypothetical protein
LASLIKYPCHPVKPAAAQATMKAAVATLLAY